MKNHSLAGNEDVNKWGYFIEEYDGYWLSRESFSSLWPTQDLARFKYKKHANLLKKHLSLEAKALYDSHKP